MEEKKQSCFNLLYWLKLEVKHCIDVTHVEKNVCDILIGTFNINAKMKDWLSARLDLIDMNVREELAPIHVGKRAYFPPVCYTLSKKEKISFSNVWRVWKCHKDIHQMLRA